MANVSDAAIEKAYNDIRDDKQPQTWLLLQYAESKRDTLEIAATGEGNAFEEMKPHFKEDQVMFGYAKATYANDKESQRVKFFLVIFIGQGVKTMRRAKVSVHKADVQKVLRIYSIEVPIDSASQFEEDDIVSRLRKAGGANYGPGT